jgi:hypothetical protein
MTPVSKRRRPTTAVINSRARHLQRVQRAREGKKAATGAIRYFAPKIKARRTEIKRLEQQFRFAETALRKAFRDQDTHKSTRTTQAVAEKEEALKKLDRELRTATVELTRLLKNSHGIQEDFDFHNRTYRQLTRTQ